MINPVSLFSNLFRDTHITPSRLYSFGTTVLNYLISANDKGQFDALIDLLTDAMASLKTELANIDENLTGQKQGTKSVGEFIVSFYTFMSDNEPFIARQLGGRDTAAYASFFPYGKTEYSSAKRSAMPMLTERVQRAAAKYQADLDPAIYDALTGFAPFFNKIYTSQQRQISTVKQDRTDRSTAFVEAQLALTTTVFTVAAQYPGDVAKCSAFFPFSMLFAPNKTKSYTVSGELEKGAAAILLNKVMKEDVVITLKNTGDLATYAVWLAASASGPMPEDAIVVNTEDSRDVKVADLGDVKNRTFFMIQNMSEVNPAAYDITFTGFTRAKEEPKPATVMKVITEEVG